MFRHTILISIIGCFITFSCGSGEETYTVEMIAGVRHVQNLAPKWRDEQRIELQFVKKKAREEYNHNMRLNMTLFLEVGKSVEKINLWPHMPEVVGSNPSSPTNERNMH